ncbi:unnamed protein product, partial [marine sediment metagenome]
LCKRTMEEIAEERLGGIAQPKELRITLNDKFVFPYYLCDECEDFLRAAIPQVLVAEGLIKFDDEKDKYVLPPLEKLTQMVNEYRQALEWLLTLLERIVKILESLTTVDEKAMQATVEGIKELMAKMLEIRGEK